MARVLGGARGIAVTLGAPGAQAADKPSIRAPIFANHRMRDMATVMTPNPRIERKTTHA
jgi:hypothetical protein